MAVVHHVTFKNETTETVTFVSESSSGPQAAFTLNPNGPPRSEAVQTPLTHELWRLVVGTNARGQYTNECVSTDELPGLAEVVVTWRENPGNNAVNNFALNKIPRRTNEGPSETRPRRLWSWSRMRGAPRAGLGV